MHDFAKSGTAAKRIILIAAGKAPLKNMNGLAAGGEGSIHRLLFRRQRRSLGPDIKNRIGGAPRHPRRPARQPPAVSRQKLLDARVFFGHETKKY
ncbi:MAG: hypothetical protein IIC13_06260 [SAR324 cluster bacterium]|nr:hypothetical protein [SAR324 cluster bacterium]